jgi:hypothetical protein
MYGDFGRYVMGSSVHQFSGVPLKQKFIKSDSKQWFRDITARRWVLQRVKQLGWTAERFKKYEQSMQWRGRQPPILERISKKYQWIALHELQAYLSDHYYLALDGWRDEKPEPFEGTWNLYAREFDPSQPLHDLQDEENVESDNPKPKQTPWWNKYPDPFAEDRLVANREAWVTAPPEDFRSLIELNQAPERNEEFVVLAGYYHWDEDLPYNKPESDFGRLTMFAHIRSWLVRKEQMSRFLSQVKEIHFWGHGCQIPTMRRGWLGEYPWGGSNKGLRQWCGEQDQWIRQINIRTVQSICDYEEMIGGILPSPQLCEILNARWAGKDSDFVDETGELVAFSPFLGRDIGRPPCIVSRKKLYESLQKAGWDIVWAVLGERSCWSSDAGRHIVPKDSQFSAIYHFSGDKIVGGITKHIIEDLPRLRG